MNNFFYYKNRLRRYIFPADDCIQLLATYLPSRPMRILDVGCGSGWFLRLVLDQVRQGSCGIGIEVDARYFTTGVLPNGNHLRILGPEDLRGEEFFDCILFNDVLHHVPDKKDFLLGYLKKISPDGYVFIKDMSAEHFVCTRWNRFHDKLLSGDSITETSPAELKAFLSPNFECICCEKKRILLYDHFWCLFKNRAVPE